MLSDLPVFAADAFSDRTFYQMSAGPGNFGTHRQGRYVSCTAVENCNSCSMSGDTHVVTNQVPPLSDHNPATAPAIVEALVREGGEWGLDEVTELGAISAPPKRRNGATWPIEIARSCTPMTVTDIGSTRSSTTRLITN